MNLEACLPSALRGPTTTITKIADGLSGAGVYRVDAAGQAFVLKIAGEDEPLAGWRSKLHIQQLAPNAGLAPRGIHVEEARRAVVSAFVIDRSFLALYHDPRTHEAALLKLGRTVRRVHEIRLPPDADSKDPRELLAAAWSALRRLVAVLLGVTFLNFAREGGHAGATGGETVGSTPSLGEFYQRLRAGSLSVATAEGQWWFGLALLKQSVAP